MRSFQSKGITLAGYLLVLAWASQLSWGMAQDQQPHNSANHCPSSLHTHSQQHHNDAMTLSIIELPYDSMLSHYQSYKEQTISNWKKSNDTVAAVGGWRQYAQEAATPDQDNSVQPKTAADPLHQHSLPSGSQP